MRKTKLLILTDYYLPHWTGIAKSIHYLVQAISQKIKITILTIRLNKKDKQNEKVDNTNIYREDYLFQLSRAKFSLTIISRLLCIVKNYDVILINSPSLHILPFAIITKLFKKKLLIFHQGDLILPKGLLNRIIEKVFDGFAWLSFSLADKIATYTLDYAQHSRNLKPFLPKFSALIIPISQNQEVKTVPTLTKLKKSKLILFGFAGRFVEEKGFDTLFQAIPLVIKAIPKVHFVFAGQTRMGYEKTYEQNQSLIKKNKKNLTFLGLLNKPKLNYFYKQIDYIIIPSRSDCFNQVQAEAMLLNTPAISSNIPGLRYLIQQTKFGYLFKINDRRDLAKTIIKASANKKKLLKYQNKPKQLINRSQNYAALLSFIEN